MGYNLTDVKWFAGSVVGGCPLWHKNTAQNILVKLYTGKIVSGYFGF